MDNSVDMEVNTHKLKDTWILWGHLPHDTDWSEKSYVKIKECNTVETVLALYENLPDNMIKNCMLFLMRKGIKPMWEDTKNKEGGCFSYKVSNKISTKKFDTLNISTTTICGLM